MPFLRKNYRQISMMNFPKLNFDRLDFECNY